MLNRNLIDLLHLGIATIVHPGRLQHLLQKRELNLEGMLPVVGVIEDVREGQGEESHAVAGEVSHHSSPANCGVSGRRADQPCCCFCSRV